MTDDNRLEEIRANDALHPNDPGVEGGLVRERRFLLGFIGTLRAEAKATHRKGMEEASAWHCICSFEDSKMVNECHYHQRTRERYGDHCAKAAREKALEELDARLRQQIVEIATDKTPITDTVNDARYGALRLARREIRALMAEGK